MYVYQAREMTFKMLAVFTLILGYAVLIKSQGFKPAGQIPDDCFKCICEASTGCDEDIGCTVDSQHQYLCGPYAMSYQYWKDGGSPGEDPSDPLDFEKCLNHKPCAEGALRGYMMKWAQDCNGDMNTNCYDWALLHKAGPRVCNGTWVQKTDFWFNFKECYDKIPKYEKTGV